MARRPLLQIDIDRGAMVRVKTCAEGLNPTVADLRALMLPVLGQVHRRQQAAIFKSQGSLGATGRWRKLSAGYAADKMKTHPRRKILHRTGEMRNRFLKPADRHYIQRLEGRSLTSWVMMFGARSRKARRHFEGAPSDNLPQRDPIGKSIAQRAELRREFVSWWIRAWLPRFQAVCGAQLRGGAQL